LFVALVSADFYMHNPRGSNDRLNGANTNRDNANRMFNSQNNDKGGYPINTYTEIMNYYEGSWLTIEWTNQHACGYANNDCTIIFQYMCGSNQEGPETRIRDGTSETTITAATYATAGANDTLTYGANEPLAYWQACNARQYNAGLYLADRNLNGQSAQFTRQSNNGDQYGFECAEERDYYPYWHPSPWKDIVVLTTDPTRCNFYQTQSQNVMNKGHCEPAVPNPTPAQYAAAWLYNNQTGCTGNNFAWQVDGTFNIAAPDCRQVPWSRDNHLGNGITDTVNGQFNHYNWTLPTSSQEPCIAAGTCRCVLRGRYNSSTYDFQGHGVNGGYGTFVDSKFNGAAKALVTNNPTLLVAGLELTHALNTNQYARTFQDRSHTFAIRKRPAGIPNTVRIMNLNVRGKRGNIVQTFPAVEYDFVPNNLILRQGDYIHPQWVGFDQQPNNGGNNGEGTDGTDRSNIVQLMATGANTAMLDTDASFQMSGVAPLFESTELRAKMAYVGQDASNDTQCLTVEQLTQLYPNDNNQVQQSKQNCAKLNAADAYFDGGLIRVNTTGVFNYASSRNNNFSNRSQKGVVTVLPILSPWAIAVCVIGGVLLIGGIVTAALVVHGKRNPNFSLNKMFERI